ncbi:hypothetical protein K9M74_01615 [Candidatus Woesearchaeota archaeon]|nr:hypothetical protein [Candidatus Woesearchaeota archaeon]
MMIIPGSVIFYRYSSDSQAALVSTQIYRSGTELIDTADLIYSVGSNSWQTLALSIPTDVHEMLVYNDTSMSELVLVYGPYKSHAVFFTRITLLNETSNDCSAGCSIPITDGVNEIRVESHANGVVRYKVVE